MHISDKAWSLIQPSTLPDSSWKFGLSSGLMSKQFAIICKQHVKRYMTGKWNWEYSGIVKCHTCLSFNFTKKNIIFHMSTGVPTQLTLVTSSNLCVEIRSRGNISFLYFLFVVDMSACRGPPDLTPIVLKFLEGVNITRGLFLFWNLLKTLF